MDYKNRGIQATTIELWKVFSLDLLLIPAANAASAILHVLFLLIFSEKCIVVENRNIQ